MHHAESSVPAERTISIVEDDESLRLALVGLLRSMAHDAYGYRSAEDFLAADESGFDCVITDIHLPGINGIEMMRRLRERGDAVPVIVVTARDEKRWVAEAKAGGALCLLAWIALSRHDRGRASHRARHERSGLGQAAGYLGPGP
jgi:FixJ family two-component response regulator